MVFSQDRQFPLAILAGTVTVMLALAPHALSWAGLVLGYFASVPLFMVGLSSNRGYLPLAAATAIAFMWVVGGVTSAAFFMFAQTIPIFCICALALRKEKQAWLTASKIVSLLTVSMLLIMALFFLWLLVIRKAPLETETTFWLQGMTRGAIIGDTTGDNNLVDRVRGTIAIILPSLIGISWILTTVFNALAAQVSLQAMGANVRPFPAKHDFDPIPTLDWHFIFLGCAVATLLQSYFPSLAAFGLNTMLLAAIPLFCLGLRIFYLWFTSLKVAKIWFFIVLVPIFGLVWPLLLVVGLGVLEPLLRLYSRLSK